MQYFHTFYHKRPLSTYFCPAQSLTLTVVIDPDEMAGKAKGFQEMYSQLQQRQCIFLIMQDDLRYDDEAIAAALNVKRTSVRSMRSRIKGRER